MIKKIKIFSILMGLGLLSACSWIPRAEPINVTNSTTVLPDLPDLVLPVFDLQDISYSVLTNDQIQNIYKDLQANPNKKIVLFVLDENSIKAIEYNFAQFGLYVDAVNQRQQALKDYKQKLQNLQTQAP